MSRSLRSRKTLLNNKNVGQKVQQKQEQEEFLRARKKSKLKKSINKKLVISSQNFVMCKIGKFDNDYEIIDKLGEGSFGTVYRVKHKKLKLQRALKTIQKKQNNLSQTFDQIQVLKKLDHINILKIYEFYQAKDSYLIVTQIFGGNQLFDQILDQQKLSQKITAKIIRQVLIALNYTHSQGIAHRDIKPQNILIKDIGTSKMNVKIIDWGLGTLLTGNYKSNRFCGTPDYAAPQTYKGIYTTQCDMWSLGVLVYIMLTGEMPFRGKNTQQTMLNAQKGVVNFKRRNFNLVSASAKQFILCLLQKDPKKRITACQALENEWIKQYKDLKSQPQSFKQTLIRLKQINIKNRFGLAVINFVNNHLSSNQQKEKLQQIFKYLDQNGDGVLSNQQLIQGYTKLYGKQLGTKIAQETFLKLDVNHNGSLQFSQFVAFGLQQKKQQQKIRLHEAFNLFDLNKDGHISYKQIGKILQTTVDKLSQQELNQLISDFDQNGDNQIDFQEFLKCISSIYQKMSQKKNNELQQKK